MTSGAAVRHEILRSRLDARSLAARIVETPSHRQSVERTARSSSEWLSQAAADAQSLRSCSLRHLTVARLIAGLPTARPICAIWCAPTRRGSSRCCAPTRSSISQSLLADDVRRLTTIEAEADAMRTAAPHEGGGGAADRARRYRRRLAGDAGAPRALTDLADTVGAARRCASSCDAERARPAAAARSDPAAGDGSRLHRARHGQDGRRRAQLFQRHRPDRVLRPGTRRRWRQDIEPAAFFVRVTRGLVKLLQERTGRRLRVPRRSAAAARSGLDPDRDLDRRRRSITTRASARTGSAPR